MMNYYHRSRELLFHFPNNNYILEENNVPGYDETMQSSSYLLMGETDVIGMERMVRDEHSSGYKTALILKVLKSIALLQPFNLRERIIGANNEIQKHKAQQSKAS